MRGTVTLFGQSYSLELPYPNQQDAVQAIRHHFQTLRHGLLRADMQSGKSGVYQTLIRQMMLAQQIDRAYILCGSHELELLNQVCDDVRAWHGGTPFEKRISVVFRQHFKRTRLAPRRMLLIVDESHLVSGRDQSVYAFLRRHGLSMAGTTPAMIRDEIYVLSVSATPFVEESVMAYRDGLPKFRVVLDSGPDYYGVESYWEEGHLRPTFSLDGEEGAAAWAALLQPSTFVLVRTHGRNRTLPRLLEVSQGCDVVRFTSKEVEEGRQVVLTAAEAAAHYERYGIVVPCLEEAPARTTIVILEGRLRCGKRVPKEHIGFVWEMGQGQTDTLLQGLIGRMCGYDVPDRKPLLFVPPSVLDARPFQRSVVPCSEWQRALLSALPLAEEVVVGPRHVAGLHPGIVQRTVQRDGVVVTPCVPVRFFLTAAEVEQMETVSFRTLKQWCMAHLAKVERWVHMTDEQREEVGAWLEEAETNPRAVHVRQYRETSNRHMHASQVRAVENRCAASEGISDGNGLTFCLTFPGFQGEDGVPVVPGEVFAVFYTVQAGHPLMVHLESRIARHDGSSHFRAMEDGFGPEILENAAAFESQLVEAISRDPKGRRVTSLSQGGALRFPRSVYGSHFEIMSDILSRVEARCGVRIQAEAKPTRVMASQSTHVEWRFLEWLKAGL